MHRWSARRQRFRHLLGTAACVYPASVHDPVSARLAADLGYEMGMFAGSVASLAVLGAPDLIVLTLTEFADQALRIGRAAELPLLVDADHGYGNALNVMRTVEELEIAGVAGLSIEDTDLPAPYGTGGKARLIGIDEAVGKLRAAVAARRDPDLVIAGRTGAPQVTSIDDTVARVRAYADSGVDAVFVVGLKTRADLERVVDGIRLPIILGGVGKALFDREYLAGLGVRICLQGHQPFAAATRALHDTLKYLREGGDPDALTTLAPAGLSRAAQRGDDYDRWQQAFLGPR